MVSSELLTQWAHLFVRSLEDLGIDHVVVSPGSRSTPLTWAISQSSKLDYSIVVDERCAAFCALGRAKYSGKPGVVLCTSGSAAANYLPAVVESSLSYAPLLVITADRPFELQQCGSPQTIDQVKLYGGFVREFFDLGLPDESQDSLRALRRTVAQAVHLAQGPVPGPVHINFRARKPLGPIVPTNSALTHSVDEICRTALTHTPPVTTRVAPSAILDLAQRCATAQRGVITLGPQATSNRDLRECLLELSKVCNFSIFCETTSQLRHSLPKSMPQSRICDAFDWLCASELFSHHSAPDFVLQIGSAPTSGAWHDTLARSPDIELHVLAEHGWQDPTSRARSVLQGSLCCTILALAQELAPIATTAPSSWHKEMAVANSRVWEIVLPEVERDLAVAPLTEPAALHSVIKELPSDALLVIGNSLPVREIDWYVKASAKNLSVVSQRGANGIDGILSVACGAASLHPGPTLCLLGDISFLHDVGGLWAARRLRHPLVIAVLNNQGGRIFEQLPLLRDEQVREQDRAAWLTPHSLDLTHAAALFGLHAASVNTSQQLQNAMQAALQTQGASVLDIRVEATSASRLRCELIAACANDLANRFQ